MRLDDLTIALRARKPWEAADLGFALVRAHAPRIYAAWVLVTLPVFVVLNVLALLAGWIWIAALALWWLKPAFDRIPLYVISRAVFGTVPPLGEVLTAQRTWGWRAIAPWLLWRRFHPGRSMLLSVDLLEGSTGVQRRERVRVLARGAGSPNVGLTLVGMNLEAMVYVALLLLGLMFVPVEFLSDSARALWQTMADNPPRWAQVLMNFLAWIAMAAIEPFYVGAGFGLYLNRRMQLEGWDIELAFRRIAARLSLPIAAALLIVALAAYAAPLRAAAADENPLPPTTQAEGTPEKPADRANAGADKTDGDGKDCQCADPELKSTLKDLFGDIYRDDGKPFQTAVVEAYDGVDLSPKQRAFVWKRRVPLADARSSAAPGWAMAVGSVIGFFFRYGLWILLAIGLVFVAIHHRRWLPWISDRLAPARAPEAMGLDDVPVAEPLPDDVPAAVRALMRASRLREAMALLYRAGVARLSESLGTPLPPGATESDCLRHARRLPDAHYSTLFTRIVRGWQAVAYAQQLPAPAELEAILVDWAAPPQAVA